MCPSHAHRFRYGPNRSNKTVGRARADDSKKTGLVEADAHTNFCGYQISEKEAVGVNGWLTCTGPRFRDANQRDRPLRASLVAPWLSISATSAPKDPSTPEMPSITSRMANRGSLAACFVPLRSWSHSWSSRCSVLHRHPAVSASTLPAQRLVPGGACVLRAPTANDARSPTNEIVPCRSEPSCSSFW
jgi:hypothetical protein